MLSKAVGGNVFIIYVAGPFRGKNAWEVEENIRRAERAGFSLAERGFMPLIPHCNTRFFNGTLTDEFWLEGTLELLKRCDAVFLVDGWSNSQGTQKEVEEAKKLGIPVYYETTDKFFTPDFLKHVLEDKARK
jgi:nucleoside 2-deoxyribosyltransferase